MVKSAILFLLIQEVRLPPTTMPSKFPETSARLIAAIGSSPQSPRWHEFIARYSPALRAFAARRFPTLDADDLLQETFLVLVRRLPDYVYAPDAKGAFHCYLVGILRCIALKTLARRMREQARLEDAGEDILHPSPDDADDASWRQAAYEIALRQFLADPRCPRCTRRPSGRAIG